MGDAYSVVLCNEVMRAKLYLLKETEERKRQFSTSNFSLCTRQRDFFPLQQQSQRFSQLR